MSENINGDFSCALAWLKHGRRVARAGWNGKGMWLRLVSEPDLSTRTEHDIGLPVLPYIVMKTATNELVPWLCSQTDMLAEDWGVVS